MILPVFSLEENLISAAGIVLKMDDEIINIREQVGIPQKALIEIKIFF